ncbi:MAG TPA: ISAs1 family transposase [Caulobacteraceae bacterium]|jgi:predicted transposase YbfD/YdcC
MDLMIEKPRLRLLLDHFAEVADPREAWRVAHPLPEVLLLVVCGSIASCDDFDDIAAWGEAHLDFLRRFLPYHHGVPGQRWLNILMNRIDPGLFSACFMAWARELRPDAPDLVALDGKTSRRSHDRSAGLAALHLVSAFATRERLVLGQEAVADKSNEIEAIPVLLERLGEGDGLKGALVTIDAVACNPKIAGEIIDQGADYLLAVKANQPTLHGEVERFFADAPEQALDRHLDLDKGHGRIEDRRVFVSADTSWMTGERRFPGEHRFPRLAAIAKVETRTELNDRCRCETRFFISSRPLTARDCAEAIRGHWRIENSLHWVLDVVFKDDLSRLRTGHGAKNMAVVRHFALNLVRTANDNHSLKTRRKMAGWSQDYLASLLQPTRR